MYGSWRARSLGIDVRVALYSANSLSRNVGPGGSSAMARYSGCSSRISFQSMVDRIRMAWVGWPRDVERYSIAW